MSYQVGQLRRGDLSDSALFTNIGTSINDQIILSSSIADFYDVGIASVQTIAPGNNYFLDFKVKRLFAGDEPVTDMGPTTLNMTVGLLTSDDDGKYKIFQTIDSYVIYPYELEDTAEENKYAYFTISFNPFAEAEYIGLILKRISYDYINPNERKIEATVNKFGTINNILPKSSVDKIGVQSKPGFLMNVNNEPIRTGRSGIFEINNGMKITFFGTPILNDNFILDYAVDE